MLEVSDNGSAEMEPFCSYVSVVRSVPVIVRIVSASGSLLGKRFLAHSLKVLPSVILKVWIVFANKVLLIVRIHSLLVCPDLSVCQLVQVCRLVIKVFCIDVSDWQLFFFLLLFCWRSRLLDRLILTIVALGVKAR